MSTQQPDNKSATPVTSQNKDDRPQQFSGSPRRIRNGIKLTTELDLLQSSHGCGVWIENARRLSSDTDFIDGLEDAQMGQVVNITVEQGVVNTVVQGSRKRPYAVKIYVPELDSQQWGKAIEVLSGDASIAAGLMAGVLELKAFDMLAKIEIPLVPGIEEACRVTCECATRGKCRHAVAALLILSQKFKQHPVELLKLRGLSLELMLERIRQHRAVESRGLIWAHTEPTIPGSHEPASSLESLVDNFWTIPFTEASDEQEENTKHVSHALLRRMGPSPLRGKFPIVGLLASIYDEVALHTSRTLDSLEDLSEPETSIDE